MIPYNAGEDKKNGVTKQSPHEGLVRNMGNCMVVEDSHIDKTIQNGDPN